MTSRQHPTRISRAGAPRRPPPRTMPPPPRSSATPSVPGIHTLLALSASDDVSSSASSATRADSPARTSPSRTFWDIVLPSPPGLSSSSTSCLTPGSTPSPSPPLSSRLCTMRRTLPLQWPLPATSLPPSPSSPTQPPPPPPQPSLSPPPPPSSSSSSSSLSARRATMTAFPSVHVAALGAHAGVAGVHALTKLSMPSGLNANVATVVTASAVIIGDNGGGGGGSGGRCETEIRPFACPTCALRFRKRCNLVTHVSNVHHKIRPFYCSLCMRRFARKSNCAKHMRLVHGMSRERIEVLKVTDRS